MTAALDADPAAASSRASCDERSPTGTKERPERVASGAAISIRSAPSRVATTVTDASAKSESSVAAQNTAATGNPVRSSRAFASASAEKAFHHVYNGPPNRPGCCPVVTTNPDVAARLRRSPPPAGPNAGASALSQSVYMSEERMTSALLRQSSVDRGG